MSRPLNNKVATRVITTENLTIVYYHNTPVVSFTPSYITLDTGGWETSTTKRRMNQVSAEFNLGYSVYQKKGEFICAYAGAKFLFDFGRITLQRNLK
jgi:hypothetical protein